MYLIVFLITALRYSIVINLYRLCSIPKFSEDAKISKGFYVIVFLISMARTTLFGVGVLEYNGISGKVKGLNETQFMQEDRWIDDAPKLLVFMIISPEYFVLIGYLILVW